MSVPREALTTRAVLSKFEPGYPEPVWSDGAPRPVTMPGYRGIILLGDPFNMGVVPDPSMPASDPEPARHDVLHRWLTIGGDVATAAVVVAFGILVLVWFGLI